MDDSKKKVVMIGVAVVCVALAIMITMKTRDNTSRGIEGVKGSMWMKCVNPDCQADYEIDKVEYYKSVKRYMTPSGSVGPMPCKKCDELASFQAVRCPKCEIVFVRGAAEAPFKDTCPDCGYSEIGERRKKAQAQREKNTPSDD